MNFLTRRFAKAPEGTAALFFIQIFATLGFAVLYSTLVLYATKHLQLSVKAATTLMGVFGAFNYGLHLFGGYLGGRFLSNRNLFVGGMGLQVFGCACIATGTLPLFYVGLALFLTGSGLNVTCINMMLTQRFTPEDPRREGAFLWNYAGMNVGFFVGFSVAGYFQPPRVTRASSSSPRSATSSPSSSPCLRGEFSPIATPRCSMRRRSSSGCASSPASPFSSEPYPSCGSCSSGRA